MEGYPLWQDVGAYVTNVVRSGYTMMSDRPGAPQYTYAYYDWMLYGAYDLVSDSGP